MTVLAQVYHYGFAGSSLVSVGAHPISRPDLPTPDRVVTGGGSAGTLAPDQVLGFADNRTYTLSIDHATPVSEAAIQGADKKRPYVLVTSANGGAANLISVAGAPRSFRIEGLWLGSADDDLSDFVVEGDWDTITIRDSTLDPGGVRADKSVIPELRLWIQGTVRQLKIERSILGRIEVRQVTANCSQSGFVEELSISDSIIDASRTPGALAIDCPTGRVVLNGVTVFGDVHALVLDASNSLVMGTLDILDREGSCFRFSAASPSNELPRTFEASVTRLIEPAFFTSLRFGDPGYAELSESAPVEIGRGGEAGSEMGAFWFLRRPIRLASIVTKVDEFKPAALLAQYILEDEHAPRPRLPGDGSENGGDGGHGGGETLSMGINLPMRHDETTITTPSVALLGSAEAGNSLDVRDGVSVFEGQSTTSFAVVASSGHGTVNLATAAGTGDVWDIGDVVLADNATVHGALRTSLTASVPSPGQVVGQRIEHATIVLGLTVVVANFPAPPADPNPNDHGTATLAPGSYGNVTFNGGTLVLSPGTYTFESLTLNTGVTFQANDGAGVILVNVKAQLIFRADTTGFSPANIRFAVFGSAGATLAAGSGTTPFLGTVVAMNGPVLIQGTRTFRGAFFGRTVTAQPGATIEHVAFSAWEASQN